ncbi:hypothetical protein QBC40DRAFT_351059 [Triangularia verruculosa]|uniref:Uncharacterized protein n=1 Tax=Triangularia verruculosa TaxID=2587418 RepID=A0AAN7ASE6_9PEZI|nr:hypothetical protein QBC40DRAFT_351059 [Triangularia verruculosa]
MASAFEKDKIPDDWSDCGVNSDDNHSVKSLPDWDSDSAVEEGLEVKHATTSDAGEVVYLSESEEADGVESLADTEEGSNPSGVKLYPTLPTPWVGCPFGSTSGSPQPLASEANTRPRHEHSNSSANDDSAHGTSCSSTNRCYLIATTSLPTTPHDSSLSERPKTPSNQDGKLMALSMLVRAFFGGMEKPKACLFDLFEASFDNLIGPIVNQLKAICEAATIRLSRIPQTTKEGQALKYLNDFCTLALTSCDLAITAVGDWVQFHRDQYETVADRDLVFARFHGRFLINAMGNVELFGAKLIKLATYAAAGVEWQMVSIIGAVHGHWAAQVNPWLALAKTKENMTWKTYHDQGLNARVNMGELTLFHSAIPGMTGQLERRVLARCWMQARI